MKLHFNEINDLLATYCHTLDDRNEYDQIIKCGIFEKKTVEEINAELSTGGFYPILKTSK